MEQTMRPGVYTSYTITPYIAQKAANGLGIAAVSSIIQDQVQKITSLEQARQLFGQENEQAPMTRMLRAALENGANQLYAVSVLTADSTGYRQAMEKLLNTNGVYTVCSDFHDKELEDFCKSTLDHLESTGMERIIVLGCTTSADAIASATRINHKRICLAYPGWSSSDADNLGPVLLGSMICRTKFPTRNLNGETVSGEYTPSEFPEEQQQEELMKAGVCLLEESAGGIALVRGLTSKTQNESGLEERVFRNLSAILVLDQVIPALRETLKAVLKEGSDNGQTTLQGIQSLTASRLEDMKEQQLISAYRTPVVYLKESDRTACVVEVDFTIRQGLNQIYLTARVTV